MIINWIGVGAFFLSLVAFFFSYHWSVKQTKKVKSFLLIGCGILAIPGMSFGLYYTHLFPEKNWYYEFRSWIGVEMVMLFVGAAGGVFASFISRAVLLIPLIGVGLFSVAPVLKHLMRPLSQEDIRNHWEDDVCLQSTASTCGAASVATILKHLDYDVTEPLVASNAYSYQGGTEAWYLARFVRSQGFEAYFDFTNAGLRSDVEWPALVGVQMTSFGHFIPILEKKGDIYVIGDPMHGRENLTEAELKKRYAFTGFYMSCKKR